MTKVIFRSKAEKDLRDIYEFIASDSPVNAMEFVRRLQTFCSSLESFPERGAPRDDFAVGVRILVFEKRITIAYRIDGNRVQILRLFHAGRNTPAAFHKK
jgi:toxin ParE1/3/4